MLTSIALVFLAGLALAALFERMKLPGLLGMILTGILLGPHVFNLLDASLLNISANLRQLALVIILTRAGLALDIADLKKMGRPALLMCFVPSSLEIAGILLLAPRLLDVSLLDAAIMGAVVAAISPAVVVPRMIRLKEEGYGAARHIPQLLMAGASVDDIFVIVLFSSILSLTGANAVSAAQFFQIPVSIATGLLAGFLAGLGLVKLFDFFHLRDSVKVLVLLSVSALLLECQNLLTGILPLSGLLAIMSMGVVICAARGGLARRLSAKYNKLWVAAEVLLFVLVGATVDVRYALTAGFGAVAVVAGGLTLRMAGVYLSLLRTELTGRERLFCMLSYIPKATVQAAIGGVPLAMGLLCGQQVLAMAVLAILLTAPLGVLGIDRLYQKLLEKG